MSNYVKNRITKIRKIPKSTKVKINNTNMRQTKLNHVYKMSKNSSHSKNPKTSKN